MADNGRFPPESNREDGHQSGGSNGRLPGGRFGPGNRYGVGQGNPTLKKMAALRAAMMDAVSTEKMAVIIGQLVALAEAGDMEAIKTLLSYTVGKPPAAIELSGGSEIGSGGPALVGIILGALARFPEARLAVVASLKDADADGHDHDT